jgi:formate dehydrogenase subunit delta
MTAGELEHLRQMANQIAANFSFHSDQVERIGDHLTRFWAPSMRKLLAEHVEQGGAGLEPAVLDAVRRLQSG